MNKGKIFYLTVVCCLLLAGLAPTPAGGKIRVVTSLPDMADVVIEIGGDRVDVYSVSRGKTDIHFFEPKPSQVMKLKKADLLVVGGLDVDVWIQSLIDASRNRKILFGAPGYVDPSGGIRPLQVPRGRIDGSMGDVHPWGNPHFWFTEENMTIAVENIHDGLCRISPADKDYFNGRKEAYLAKVRDTFRELREKMKPYKGTRVFQYHQSWDYFCREFGLEIAGSLEPKPGIPPTPSHLQHLVALDKDKKVSLILVEPYYSSRPVKFIVRETGVNEVRMPLYLTGDKGRETYLDNLRKNVEIIINALS